MFLVDIGVYDYNSRWGDKMDLIAVAKFLSTALVIVFGLALHQRPALAGFFLSQVLVKGLS